MKKKKSIKPSDEGWVQDVDCPVPGQIICFRSRKLCPDINVFYYEPVCFFYENDAALAAQPADELSARIQVALACGRICECETEVMATVVASHKVVNPDRSARGKSDREPHVRIELLAYARIPEESEFVSDADQLVNISFSVFEHQMPIPSPFDVVC